MKQINLLLLWSMFYNLFYTIESKYIQFGLYEGVPSNNLQVILTFCTQLDPFEIPYEIEIGNYCPKHTKKNKLP